MEIEKNSTGFLSDLTEQIALRLRKKTNMSQDKAIDIAVEVSEEIRKLWGGVSVYICKTDVAVLDARHEEIFEAWKKEGFHLDLCRRFDLSEQRIRQIVAIKRAERRQKTVVQPLLSEVV